LATFAELLVDELDGDLATRQRELADLRLLLAASSGPRRDMLSRACHVMVYAHWEGFVKKALRTYLQHVVALQVPLGKLKYELQVNSMRASIKTAAAPSRAVEEAAQLLRDIDLRGSQPFTADAKEIVKIGNMNGDSLRVLLGCAALPYLSAYATREQFIDVVVCGRRHRIAHGDWQPVSSDEARSVARDVMELCSVLNDQVQTATVYREYLLT
jgi:hypothetical protein